MKYEDVERRLRIFLGADFIGMHHSLRVEQIKELEKGRMIHQSPLVNQDWKSRV